MNAQREQPGRIQGVLIRLDEGHEVAIYLRNGVPSVAEFRNGAGEVCAAGAWLSLNGHRLAGARHRREVEPGLPIPAETAERIERLHRSSRAPDSNAIVRALAQIAGVTRAGSADSLA